MYIFFDRCDLGIDNNNENGYRVAAIFSQCLPTPLGVAGILRATPDG